VAYASNPPAPGYANWGQRAGAYLIDIAPVIVLEIIGALFLRVSFLIYLLFILAALGWTIYNRWITMGRTGQSLGKRTLNQKLIGEASGQPIGAGLCFVRDIAHIVDSIICYIGWLFPLWDAKRQTLADKIMSTVVINV
jgi:uncharacterized RDD family membrane protein YckC